MDADNPLKQEANRNPDGTFIAGVSGNPAGRPKGKTMKEYAREWFLNKTEEEKKAYIEELEDLRPGFAWEMSEGKARQETDLKGNLTISQILDGVESDNG